jgi:hypothetical protein
VKSLAVTFCRREEMEPAIAEARHRVALRRMGRGVNACSVAPETVATETAAHLLPSAFVNSLDEKRAGAKGLEIVFR